MTFTTVDDPLAAFGTTLTGISGKDAVGNYKDSHGVHYGFTYNISSSTFTAYSAPGSVQTNVNGIDGNSIVGGYGVSGGGGGTHGFVDNGSTITTLDDPLALQSLGTVADGISGTNIVGAYRSSLHQALRTTGSYSTERPTRLLMTPMQVSVQVSYKGERFRRGFRATLSLGRMSTPQACNTASSPRYPNPPLSHCWPSELLAWLPWLVAEPPDFAPSVEAETAV